MMEKFNNGKLYAHKVFLKGVLADIENKKSSSNYVIRRQKIYGGKHCQGCVEKGNAKIPT